MPIDTTLLDLDRAPTLDELKEFFKKHDWTTAKISDPKSRTSEKVADMEHVKKIMNAEVEKQVREKGTGTPSRYFENRRVIKGKGGNVFDNQGNPLLEMRDNTEDLVSDAVYEIAVNHEDILDAIFSRFDFTDPDFEQKADAFLKNAVGTMLDVMEYEKLAKLIHELSDFEDFNPKIIQNFKAIEHERSWYHLDTKHPTLPDPDVERLRRHPYLNPEEYAISNITVEEFWKSIEEKDRIILKMIMYGYTQTEVAKAVGMASNSGVSKRIAKLRKVFLQKTGLKVE